MENKISGYVRNRFSIKKEQDEFFIYDESYQEYENDGKGFKTKGEVDNFLTNLSEVYKDIHELHGGSYY